MVAQKRYNNFDLLKILCMFMIVASHFSVHGNWPLENSINVNSMFLSFLGMLGNLAVNCYIIISAYFMVNRKMKIERLLRIIFKTLFYTVGVYLLLCAFGYAKLNINTLFTYFPFREKSYWFVDNYILLMIFSPLLNIVVNGLTKKQLCYSIAIGLFFSSVLSAVFLVDTIVSYFFWFVVLYFIGAYLRLHFDSKVTLRKQLILTLLGMILIFLIINLLRYYEISTGNIIGSSSYYFAGRNRLIVVFTSIQIFILFSKIKISSSKMIDFLSKNSFSVYLIHDNAALRYLMWHIVINVGQYFYSRGLVIYACAIIIIIFVACIIISSVVTNFIENPIFHLLQGKIDSLQEKYNNVWGINL